MIWLLDNTKSNHLLAFTCSFTRFVATVFVLWVFLFSSIAVGQNRIESKGLWEEMNSINWETFSKSQANSGRYINVDIDKSAKRTLQINQFRSLSNSPKQWNLSFDKCPQTLFSLDKVPKRKLKWNTEILGTPEVTITTLPQMSNSATGPVLLFNKDHGVINDNYVNCMAQDDLGRIWIGTNRGVSVYDGESSYSYLTKQGLSENRVWSITIDQEGLVWIGTFSGLDVIDPNKNTISHINSEDWLHNNYGHALELDRNGNIWFGTVHGLFLIDKKMETIYKYTEQQGLLSSVVRNLFCDDSGKVWVAQNIGLSIVNLDKKWITRVGENQGITNARVTSFEQKNELCFYFANSHGLYLWDWKNETIYQYDLATGFPDKDIRSLKKNVEGMLFVGTRNKGIIVFDQLKQQFKTIWRQEGLSSDYVPFHFFDSDQQHWIGGFTGIHLIKNVLGDIVRLGPESGIRDQNYSAFVEDNNGNIWVGGNSGLDIYNLETGILRCLKTSDYGTSSGCNSLFQDSKGFIYIGTFGGGMSIYNPRNMKVRNVGQNQGLGNYGISFFKEDKKGRIWVGTQSGINLFNQTDEDLEIKEIKLGLGSVSFISATVDSDENLWFTSDSGVFHYDVKKDQWKQLDLIKDIPNKRVNEICTDHFGRIWMGTDEDGIYVYDTNETIVHFTKEDGLAHMRILSFVSTKDEMFVATTKSLTVINLHSFSLKNYDKTQGLSSTDFKPNAALRLKNNQIWWGMVDGIFILDPKPILGRIAETRITAIIVNGEEQNFFLQDLTLDTLSDKKKQDSVHNADLVQSWRNLLPPYFIPEFMELKHSKNHIEFLFSGMQVNEPNHVRYKYMLEGLDADWSPFTNKNTVEYRNLSPGDYTFLVTSCGLSDGCGKPAEVSFTILPPFWRTYWFYVLCLFSLITFIYFYNSYRVNLFRIQTQELEREVALRTNEFKVQKDRAERSEQFKQQFLSNMSHEIRTPMNAVMGIVNILLDLNPTKSQKEYLNVIKGSSENLLVILNDILDLGKIEAGKMELEHIDISLREVVDLVIQTMQYKADAKGLKLRMSYDENIPQVLIGDPTRINQVLVNLVGNAIKFTESGQVFIKVKLIGFKEQWAKIRFEVKDTGIGMLPEQLDRIFRHFTQASNSTTRKYGGTGLGLSISKHLVELFGGEIYVKSKAGKGSQFSFEITLRKSKNVHSKSLKDRLGKIDTKDLIGLKVLIAEDNEYNRLVAKDTLQLKIPEVYVSEAYNGLEAVKMVRQNSYDVVLMDMHMPELDGMQAVKQIREFNTEIPIVAFTASVVKNDVDKYTLAGMNGFVPKPFRPYELLMGIYNAIKDKKTNVPELETETSNDIIGDKRAIINLEFLRDFVNNDEQKLQQYIQMYLKSMRENLIALEESITQKDFGRIKTIMHTVKPQLRYMGMTNTANLANEIEEKIENEQWDNDLNKWINRFTVQCRSSIHELESN